MRRSPAGKLPCVCNNSASFTIDGEQLSPELVSILAVGVALAGLTLTALRGVRVELHAIRTELNEVRTDVADLRERVARLEGMFEGFLRKGSAIEPDAH